MRTRGGSISRGLNGRDVNQVLKKIFFYGNNETDNIRDTRILNMNVSLEMGEPIESIIYNEVFVIQIDEMQFSFGPIDRLSSRYKFPFPANAGPMLKIRC